MVRSVARRWLCARLPRGPEGATANPDRNLGFATCYRACLWQSAAHASRGSGLTRHSSPASTESTTAKPAPTYRYPRGTPGAFEPLSTLRMLRELLAPRAGFEPATNRLTAGCSTTDLPGNDARHAVMHRHITKPPALCKACWTGRLRQKRVEATPGIEPGYADLQSAASPLRHVALVGNRALELQVPRLPDAPAIQEPSARSNGLDPPESRGLAWISPG
jgi:hypothetical protein